MKKNVSKLMAAASLLLAGVPLAMATQPAVHAAVQEQKESEAEKNLLKVGQMAPDFTLPLLGGGEVTLANLLPFHKAVLVCFWGVDAAKGGAEMQQVVKLYNELAEKELTVVTINPSDDREQIEEFVQPLNISFPVAIDGKETNRAVTGVYRARNLPTYYVLDPEGKVLWRGIGLKDKEASLRQALEKAGVK